MNIGSWLRNLRLEQYAPAFRENDVDADKRDLKEAKALLERLT
jgi:hypothetical protein